jgi:6-pyruvoyl-tetrahydropterin synthase
MRTHVLLPAVALVMLATVVPAALAEDADLKQTTADLTAQSRDKERLDTRGAVKIELDQIRTWLSEAQNAINEKKEKLCREIFDRVRAQLKLVDELVALSQLEAEAKRLEQGLANARKAAANAKSKLEERQAQLRALKITNKEK